MSQLATKDRSIKKKAARDSDRPKSREETPMKGMVARDVNPHNRINVCADSGLGAMCTATNRPPSIDIFATLYLVLATPAQAAD